MNRKLPESPVLPRALGGPAGIPLSPELRRHLEEHSVFARDLVRAVSQDLTDVHSVINSMVQGVGAPLASAATITVDHPIHTVTGTAAIATINAPAGFSGPIFLLASDAWSIVTGGNIALALTATAGTAIVCVYDYVTAMWSPIPAGTSSFDPAQIEAEIAALQASVMTLQTDVTTLQSEVTWLITYQGVHVEEVLTGTMNGSNTIFTVGFPIALQAGRPLGILNFRGSRTYYVPAASLQPNTYTLVDARTIRVFDPPMAGDVLMFDWVLESFA